MLDKNLKSRIQKNREKLSPIVGTIKLCGHLGVPLRGHIDDTKYHAELGSFSWPVRKISNFKFLHF